MKWVILILTIGLAVYLIVDTTIYCVKKIKAKKKTKAEKENTEVQIIDNNDSK